MSTFARIMSPQVHFITLVKLDDYHSTTGALFRSGDIGDKPCSCHRSKMHETLAIIGLSPMSPMSPMKYPSGGESPAMCLGKGFIGAGDCSRSVTEAFLQRRLAHRASSVFHSWCASFTSVHSGRPSTHPPLAAPTCPAVARQRRESDEVGFKPLHRASDNLIDGRID